MTAVTSLTFEVDAQQGRVVRFLSTPEERQVRVFEDEEETLVTLQCELLGSERAHYDFNASWHSKTTSGLLVSVNLRRNFAQM